MEARVGVLGPVEMIMGVVVAVGLGVGMVVVDLIWVEKVGVLSAPIGVTICDISAVVLARKFRIFHASILRVIQIIFRSHSCLDRRIFPWGCNRASHASILARNIVMIHRLIAPAQIYRPQHARPSRRIHIHRPPTRVPIHIIRPVHHRIIS